MVSTRIRGTLSRYLQESASSCVVRLADSNVAVALLGKGGSEGRSDRVRVQARGGVTEVKAQGTNDAESIVEPCWQDPAHRTNARIARARVRAQAPERACVPLQP